MAEYHTTEELLEKNSVWGKKSISMRETFLGMRCCSLWELQFLLRRHY